jgi:uncharacterized damage-inducible protein DinB
MDREPALLANHIKRTVTGPMWHGPALAEVLAGISHEQASARPLPEAHTIWEIVLHVTAWAETARARVHGERTGDPPASEDWPPVAPGGETEWTAAVDRLQASHRALAQDVRQLDETALQAKVAGLDYTVSNLLHGVIEHGTYHGGQMALLKKALASRGQGRDAQASGAEASRPRA